MSQRKKSATVHRHAQYLKPIVSLLNAWYRLSEWRKLTRRMRRSLVIIAAFKRAMAAVETYHVRGDREAGSAAHPSSKTSVTRVSIRLLMRKRCMMENVENELSNSTCWIGSGALLSVRSVETNLYSGNYRRCYHFLSGFSALRLTHSASMTPTRAKDVPRS